MPDCVWTTSGCYFETPFDDEADLERAILEIQDTLFGANRIYLDVKKKIGIKGGVRNIPDGYLIDLTGPTPSLFVVENELAAHDPLRHIAIQILQFSISFESEPYGVKKILLSALSDRPDAKHRCEKYVTDNGFRSLDHLLESLVTERPFAALVIIDTIPENLENILAKKFKFGVEVVQVARYQSTVKQRFYRFEPFLSDLQVAIPDMPGVTKVIDASPSDFDTIVVPAREEGFKEVFLGENKWRALGGHPKSGQWRSPQNRPMESKPGQGYL